MQTPDLAVSRPSADAHRPGSRGNWPERLAVGGSILFVLVAYLWIATLGTWTSWPYYYDYSHYDKLADAFLHGQVSLRLQPSPALLALPDPYDPAQRKDVPFLSDASLYQGRYYLYFGPVPALLLLIPKLLMPTTVVHDVYLIFGLVCALFVVQALFVLSLRERIAKGARWWHLVAAILLIGFSAPYTWLLGSPVTPHNAAIAAGQACFIGGLWAVFSAVSERQVQAGKAMAGGVLFALAIGSRLTQAVPVAVIALLLAPYLLRRPHEHEQVAKSAVLFLAPLIAGLAVLAWYNWARFGSITETGISYQLATLPIQQHMNELFSGRYLVQNLYNYLLNPPRLRLVFPYIWPQLGSLTPIAPGTVLSPIYFTEENTGLLFMAPMVLFAAAALVPSLRSSDYTSVPEERRRWLHWLKWALGLAFVSEFAVFLAFFWADNRYLVDFFSPLLLLSILDFWLILGSLKERPKARRRAISVAVIFMCVALVFSIALPIAENAGPFAAFDPKIGRLLRSLFGP